MKQLLCCSYTVVTFKIDERKISVKMVISFPLKLMPTLKMSRICFRVIYQKKPRNINRSASA